MDKLKILTVNHHTAYLYSLAKTGHTFYVLGHWDDCNRPLPNNFHLISRDDVMGIIRDIDIIIGHHITADLKTIWPKSIRFRKPYIQVIHGRKARTGHSRSSMKRLAKRLYASSILKTIELSGMGKFVYISDYDKSDWPMKGTVIDQGIPVDEMYRYSGQSASLLVVGNALNREHFDFKSLTKLQDMVSVKISGVTPELKESQPARNWDELRTFYREYRAFINLTREPEKGYNLATLEAMATGMPVISLDHPFTPIKNGWNGYLVRDFDELVEKSRVLLGDLELARKLGKNAKKTVIERYHINNFVAKWNAVLEESCEHRRSSKTVSFERPPGLNKSLISKHKVFMLHSEISPYRLPLFEQLSDKLDLSVCFATRKSGKRRWNTSTVNFSFNFKVLKNISIGRLIINYLLPFEINLKDYDVLIIDDDPRLILSRLYILLFAKFTGRPFIVWSGAVAEGYYNRFNDAIYRLLIKPLHKIVYKNAAAFLTYGNKTADYLQKNGIAPGKIFVGTQAISLKNGLNGATDKGELKKKLNLNYRFILLFVGYLTKRKGVYDVIKAFKRIKDADVALVVGGAGRVEKRLKRLTNGLDNIFFPGYIDGDLKAEYYQIADVFVLPSYIDPWPVAVLEAMMYNLPVITTTGAGCTADLVDEGNLLTIKPGDIGALQQAMERLIREDKTRRQMSKKSQAARKKFSIENRKKIFVDAIEFCLSNKNI